MAQRRLAEFLSIDPAGSDRWGLFLMRPGGTGRGWIEQGIERLAIPDRDRPPPGSMAIFAQGNQNLAWDRRFGGRKVGLNHRISHRIDAAHIARLVQPGITGSLPAIGRRRTRRGGWHRQDYPLREHGKEKDRKRLIEILLRLLRCTMLRNFVTDLAEPQYQRAHKELAKRVVANKRPSSGMNGAVRRAKAGASSGLLHLEHHVPKAPANRSRSQDRKSATTPRQRAWPTAPCGRIVV